MHDVFLNGKFLPLENAKISPMDRGFLFGDGIYEVIPSYNKKTVGLELHLARMQRGLNEININYEIDLVEWRKIVDSLLAPFEQEAIGIYIHISRGADSKRFHAYPKGVTPTVFAYGFEIAPSTTLDRDKAKTFVVATKEDLRWQRCHIKSTSLLGNVMHFQEGQNEGVDEVLLHNRHGQLTEAAACNVFIVKNDEILTPPLDNQLLPGITRHIILEALKREGGFKVTERAIEMDEIKQADEVWITSSSKEIGAVVKVDDTVIGEGKPGEMWLRAQRAYNRHKFDVFV
ncbi:aminotransferase class IV [Glaciecola sp. 1036]|uniref:aminotransferase class IV n=1 Tax=Alteromonadaceae TaxID=72275 RepID=UPI003CFC5A72